MKIIIVVALALSACTPAMHRAYRSAFASEITAAITCDYGQTMRSVVHGDGTEVEHNPLLGEHPSGTMIAGASLLAIAGVAVLTMAPDRIVPDEIKDALLTIIAFGETSNIYFNAAQDGHGITWCGR